MPIRQDEDFCPFFLGDTEEEALENYNKFSQIISLLARNYTVFGADPDDLFQEGLIGLARAVRAFDKTRSSGDKSFKIFAIYYIKNAMREFLTKQEVSLKIPQYLRDGIRLLIMLRELLGQAGEQLDLLNIFDIWELAEKRTVRTELDKKIKETTKKFSALANRSSVSVYNLLKRIEPLPLQLSDVNANLIEFEDYEDYVVNSLDTSKNIEWLMDLLTDEEFELLWQYYVNQTSLRELSKEMGVSAVSVGNKVRKLKKRLNKAMRRRIYEDKTNSKKTNT